MTQKVAAGYFQLDYGEPIETEIEFLRSHIARRGPIAEAFEPRWLALKLIEGEADIIERVRGLEGGVELLRALDVSLERLQASGIEEVDITIADQRYAFVSQIIGEVLRRPSVPAVTPSERIDRVVTDRWLGVPIFLAVMYLVFNLVVNVSTPYLDWIDSVFGGPLTNWAGTLLSWVSAPMWLEGLVLNGIFPGVGGVLVFIPGLAILFLFIALLEDTGYMARAAFVMNRFLSFLGLSGKSFVPLILGFGCGVPAIYATRTLENRRDRILTSMLVPLMSCAARLPVFVVFGLAFFRQSADLVIWSLYALGIAVAAVMGLIFSRTIFKGQSDPLFVMELPPYRMPTLRSLWFHVSQRVGEFIRNAGTVILAASIVIWILLSLPVGTTHLSESWFGGFSAAIAPVFEPAGFGNWESSGSLVAGLVAKEVVVSTMSQIFLGDIEVESETDSTNLAEDLAWISWGLVRATADAGKELVEVITPGVDLFMTAPEKNSEPALSGILQSVFNPISALAFMVFVLLYVPCVATLGAIRGEFGWKWAVFSASYQVGVAWIAAVLVYQGGTLLGFGG